MTDLATVMTVEAKRPWPRATPTLAAGVLGGLALGLVARAWMRLIAEEPDFTWSGTLFIVGGFTIFGLAQSIVVVARRRTARRWTLTIARVLGTIGLLPLFVGAGALMLPTVVPGGLALARADWRRVTRGICLLVAAGPVSLVGSDLVNKFGWSLHSLAGFVVMLAVYGTIIRATRFTLAPQADGWRMPRWATATASLVLGLLFLIALVGGGIN